MQPFNANNPGFCLFFIFFLLPFLGNSADIPLGSTIYPLNSSSSWSSQSLTFTLSFVASQTSPNLYYPAIQYSSVPVWYPPGPPLVDSGGSLRLLQSGNLVLTNSSGFTLWQTYTSSLGITSASLQENGNFVLKNSSSSVWQSFENPTDTILQLQNFTLGQTLVSNSYSFSLLATGNLTLKFNNSNTKALFLARSSLAADRRAGMVAMALTSPSLLSSRSLCRSFNFNPTFLFSPRSIPRRYIPRRFTRRRLFSALPSQDEEVFTSPSMAKSFDFASEERIYNWWESQGFFKPSFDRAGAGADPFVISMPPPNVTGSLHMGHAMFVTLEDIMMRYFRMKGRPALWVPGTDHAGIATQLVVEKMLAKEGVKRTDLSREEFTKRVWEWKEKYGGTITKQIRRLGASCDWSKEHFTLDEQLSRAVVEAFVSLHEKGLIYQGSYLVNWSPALQTAVSDLEVEYSEEPGYLYHIKYRFAGGTRNDFLTVATTRPETLFADTAIAVHPEDKRYAKYIGGLAIVPMTFGRHIPIIADKYVDKEFGTGVLKISPGHDHNDYHIARKLGLPILNVMNKDGTLNDAAGIYSGMDRFDARKKLWADLEETGLAVKKEPHTLRVPRSQRGGEVIEPLVSKQWFVTMEPLAEKALSAVENGQVTILPERFEKIYNHWLTNIKDWCISRQLWWGHRIPVWYIEGKDCEEHYIVARDEKEALEKAKAKYGKAVEIYQDPDVLDTWFSSSLWPFSTLGWPDLSSEDLQKFYPTTILETGHDILFFWVARMVMMGLELTGTVPFSYVYLHGLIRDAQGRKMSKTLGNVIDPLDTIKEYGTDALRFTISLGTAGQDLNLSMERLSANKAFTNKLWNAGKFIIQNLPDKNDASSWELLLTKKFDTETSLVHLPLPECWVVSELHQLINSVTASYEKFFFNEAGREIYDFFWGEFADWYIEASKTRLYHSGDNSMTSTSQAVLLYVFENILKLLHPFMPFVTEELWQALPYRKQALIISAWPSTSLPRDAVSVKRFQNLQALIRAIRNARAENSVEPAKRISASIVASSDVLSYISSEKDVLALLSRLDLEHVNFTESPPGDVSQSVHIVASEGLEAYLPLADMVDVSSEIQRLSKRLTKMQSEYDALVARLNAPSFIEKAPAEVVCGVREKASEAEEKISLTKKRLAFLQSTVAVAK